MNDDIERIPIMSPLGARIYETLRHTQYFVANYGVNILTEKGSLQISNFVVIPTEFITKNNGRTEEKFIKVIGYTIDGQLPEVQLPLKEFERMDWITSKWGFTPNIRVVSNASQHIRQVALLLGDEFAKYITVYTFTGWKCINGNWGYLHGGGAIGKDNTIVELSGNMNRYSLPNAEEDYREAIAASYSFRETAPLNITIPLLALTYLSVLNEFFKQSGFEPSFVTMLVGPTGTLKSSLSALALNHFGESFRAKYSPGSFKDTANALEAKASMLKDTLFIVDDYIPSLQPGEYAKMTGTMQSLIRAYGDRVGRGRLSADAKLKDAYVPHGNLLVTGEDVPRLEESGLARLLFLEVEKGQINDKKVSELQKKTKLLAQAMRGYIEWILPQTKTLPDMLAKKFIVYREQAQVENGHLRLAETVAWLYTGYEMFIEYAALNGVINASQRQDSLDEAWEELTGLADRQQKRIDTDNPVAMFLTALNELLLTEKCVCIKLVEIIEEDAPPRDDKEKPKGFGGYEGSECFLLIPNIIMAMIKDFYKRQDTRFSTTLNMLLKMLDAKGFIEVDTQQDRVYRTKNKKIDGVNRRLIWLKKTALENLNDLL